MMERHFFVQVPPAVLQRLQQRTQGRYRFYSEVKITHVPPSSTAVERLVVTWSNETSEVVMNAVLDYVAGFIEGADLESSTPVETHQELTLELLLVLADCKQGYSLALENGEIRKAVSQLELLGGLERDPSSSSSWRLTERGLGWLNQALRVKLTT